MFDKLLPTEKQNDSCSLDSRHFQFKKDASTLISEYEKLVKNVLSGYMKLQTNYSEMETKYLKKIRQLKY